MANETNNNEILDINDILKKIESLSIYERDYDIIISLLDNIKDKRLFLKILEEVINGNLFWSDFDTFLSYTNYPSIIEDVVKTQKNIEDYIERLKNFETVLEKHNIKKFSLLNNNSNFIYNKKEEDDSFYEKEKNIAKYNIIYEIVRPDINDDVITSAIKAKLLDSIIQNNNTIDNLFTFLEPYNLPIDYRFQILDSFDKDYMEKNNLSENQMKQFKELSFLLRKKESIESSKRKSEGGE